MNTINRYTKTMLMAFTLFASLFINACSDDDPPLPANVASFETTSAGVDEETGSADVKITFTRAVDVATDVVLTVTTEGVTYGEHFTTVPAIAGGEVKLTIPAGSNTATLKVVRVEEAFLEGTEQIVLKLKSITDPSSLIGGTAGEMTVSFGAIVSEGSELQLNGLIGEEAGGSAGNSVFVDFSNNQQSPVARTSWDLGFHGGDAFRVIINNTNGASVLAIDKTDINAVTIDDVDTEAIVIPLGTPGAASFEMIDDVFGSLDKTAIAAIDATDANNLVYVLNRAGGSHEAPFDEAKLVKIRVIRKGDGYTLQYAKINETTFSTLDITKDASRNFSYVSLGGVETLAATAVTVEPAKAKWDIEWSWSVYVGGAGENIFPYGYADVVFVNHLGGVSAAEVPTTTSSYEDFDEADLSAITFKNERNVIGSTWRATTGTIGVKTDRFYVVKDAAGNVYKLRFVSFHSADSGTRGKPVIQYELVKKAEG